MLLILVFKYLVPPFNIHVTASVLCCAALSMLTRLTTRVYCTRPCFLTFVSLFGRFARLACLLA